MDNNFNNDNNEIFSGEELKSLNETLKKSESIEFPESLSSERIKEKIKSIGQDEATKAEISKKKHDRRLAEKILAIAAAVAIVVTSAVVVKPWNKVNLKPQSETKAPVAVADYSEIESLFSSYSKNYKKLSIKSGIANFFSVNNKTYGVAEDLISAENGASAGASGNKDGNTVSGDTSHGETNTQVNGVDEADIIKNDGKYIYAVMPDNANWDAYYASFESDDNTDSGEVVAKGYNPNGDTTEKTGESSEFSYDCKIAIIETNADGTMKKVGEVNIAPETSGGIYYMSVSEMYVKGNRLVAVLSAMAPFSGDKKNENNYYSSKAVTAAVSFDITDRQNPKEEWRVFQDGYYNSSRMINDKLVLITSYSIPLNLDDIAVKENCVPNCGTGESGYSRMPLSGICIMDRITDSSYLVASSLDVNNAYETFVTEAVLGGGGNVYCTENTLYVASTCYKENDANIESKAVAEIFDISSNDASYTSIYKFDISGSGIKYLCNGSVKGSALDQFSIDEYNGYLRIATTTGFWGENTTNQIYVLSAELETVGSLENISKGETIRSVRFTGDTGYVVTFLQTDPLFVIDLSDAASPKILGELKIPGFSSYLHPITDSLVLGVGFDGDDDGTNGKIKISLFDVSDRKNPKEVSKYVIGKQNGDNSVTYSECAATYDHKALCYNAEKLTMYLPYREHTDNLTSTGDYIDTSANETGVLALEIDVENKTLTEAASYKKSLENDEYDMTFGRTTYTGGNVYGISNYSYSISSFNIETQKPIDTLDYSK